MKKKLTSNLMLKIVSVVIAFLFWLVVINLIDPTTSKTFYDIPVEILNENVITSANQVYEIQDGDEVNVTVKGKRSFLETLTDDDFTATADLSELSKVNAVNINVKLNKTSSSAVELDWDNAVLKVSLEERITKNFKVEVDYEGDLGDDYVLGEMVAKPNIVEVSCGESKFNKIDHVGVMVTLDGESEDFEAEYSPVLYDESGEAIDNTNVTFGSDSILVSVQVLETKEIPIYITVSGSPADGYSLTTTDYKPESVRVYGTAEALESATSITIPIQLDGEKKDVEKEIDLTEYLSDGLYLVDDTSTVSVRCEINKDGQRTLTMTTTDIAVKNLPDNHTMNFTSGSDKYTVKIVGDEDAISDISVADLGAYVDLTGLSEGAHTLDVQYSLPVGVKVKNNIKVTVTLSDQTEEESTATPTASTAGVESQTE